MPRKKNNTKYRKTVSFGRDHNGKLIRYTGEQRAQSLIRWVAKAMPNEASRRSRLFSSVVERLTSRKGRSK